MNLQRLKSLILISSLPALLLLFWLSSTAQSAPPTAAPAQLAPAIHTAINQATTEPIRFIAYFHTPIALDLDSLPEETPARRAALVDQLQTAADISQRSVLAQLEQDERVTSHRSLWSVNAIAITADTTVIQELATNPAVARIEPDAQLGRIEPSATLTNSLRTAATTAETLNNWGLAATQSADAWHAFGTRGEGVTIAIMDSGVDWLHPDLSQNYRGRQPDGTVQHAGHWYHAAVPTITTPIDLNWHGTHVAGTAIGQNGIGVAPDAQWIAVSIADQFGFFYTSAVHDAFQWLLAPNGDPALAPDIVNGSWGAIGDSDVFYEDVQLLREAGIIPVFAAGNEGPGPNSVNYPGSYDNAISVGAIDYLDVVTWFSSRGPSSFTTDTKPDIVAPGAQIFSTYPNNQYAYANGTSMATPHVSGAIALILSADDTLTYDEVWQTLTSTAAPFDNATFPNDSGGWGKLDSFAAVQPHTNHGRLTGRVTDNGQPIPQATVNITTPSGGTITHITDNDGRYNAPLQTGSYTLLVQKFGYDDTITSAITVQNDNTTTRNVSLTKQPHANFVGVVRNTAGLISATVTISDTDIVVNVGESGVFNIPLPPGTYTVQIRAKEHLVHTSAETVPAAGLYRTYTLPTGPTIMLIDAGQWHYESEIISYRQTLDALNYYYDEWIVKRDFADLPPEELLATYDYVIWSTPYFAPGFLANNRTVTNYLNQGGNLLIAGPNIGFWEDFPWYGLSWWHTHLRAEYQTKLPPSVSIQGAADGPFAGMDFTLNDTSYVQNLAGIDAAVPRADTRFTQPLLTTEHEGESYYVGLTSGQCDPYNIVYLGFGLEGVDNINTSKALVTKSLEHFNRPLTQQGVFWESPDVKDLIAPGEQLVYPLEFKNGSETMPDTFSIQVNSDQWPVELSTSEITLDPCETGTVTLTVTIPADVPLDTSHLTTLTAQSNSFPSANSALQIEHKTAAPILIVDDHRWYAEKITRVDEILSDLNIRHDIWDINDLNLERGSPSVELLQQYEFVLWFTAYDWFQPIQQKELQAIEAYIESGGRFFLSSQDFMYYHRESALAQEYFGIQHYYESITPTVIYPAYGIDMPLISATTPVSLTYAPYKNNGDGLIPRSDNQIQAMHNRGIAAVGRSGITAAGTPWRTTFWGVPLEVVESAVLTHTVTNMLGWLGDLGDSTFVVDQPVAPVGGRQTYTLTLHNSALEPNQVTALNQLPPELTLLPETIQGGATYNPATRQLQWEGELNGQQTHLITYQAQTAPGLPAGTQLINPVTISYAKHEVQLTHTAEVWLNTPDFSTSQITMRSDAPYAPTTTITYVYTLTNSGLTNAAGTQATFHLPRLTTILTDTLQFSSGTAELTDDQQILWQGDLAISDTITLSLMMTTTQSAENQYLTTLIEIDDGVSNNLHVLHDQTLLPAHNFYLPQIHIIRRE